MKVCCLIGCPPGDPCLQAWGAMESRPRREAVLSERPNLARLQATWCTQGAMSRRGCGIGVGSCEDCLRLRRGQKRRRLGKYPLVLLADIAAASEPVARLRRPLL